MTTEFRKHKLAYSFLIVGLVLAVLLFLAAWPSRVTQRVVAVALSIYYISWGIATHLKSDHITKRVIYEYVGVGTLGGLLLILITF